MAKEAAKLIEEEKTMEKEEATEKKAETAPLSKNAQKRLLKQQRYEAKKAEKKAEMKELKNKKKEEKRLEWQEKLSTASEEEKLQIAESRLSLRKERMDRKSEEKAKKIQRLEHAKLHGQNVVIDLQFSHLMSPNEMNSLSQQIMYCYAVNSKCASPAHLWLTGCTGDIGNKLNETSGFDKWMIEKEATSYTEALQDRKDKLVYLTADAETVLDDLDLSDIYIIGGLVDRNRWKGITLNKAQEQGIRTAKLPIGSYLKMSSSQVLTVNQVLEILLTYLETRDWKASFFKVIPQRKRCGAVADANESEAEDVESEVKENSSISQKKKKISSPTDDGENED